MKKLIFPMIFISIPLLGHTQEIFNAEDGKQIVSRIKDIEVQEMLSKTGEFKNCRDKNPFVAGEDEPTRTKKIKDAEACFKAELSKNSSAKKLEELSETLRLQQYGLVPSKNVKDIQKYLSDKMTKALTGVDPNEPDPKKLLENMKFKNRKIVDQKVFIDLYKSQLGKNALYEVSRFCFENLRKTGEKSKITFADHWAGYQSNIISEKTIDLYDDSGEPKFGKTLQDASDKDKVFQDIFQSINGASGTGLNENEMSAFFMDCGKIIVPLCKKFEASLKFSDTYTTTSKVDVSTASTTSTPANVGAAACLAKNRIQEYKKALVNAEKVSEQFAEMGLEAQKSALISLQDPVKFYGRSADDESIDDLTNNTSADIFTGGYTKDQLASDKAKECEEKPELATCESFISKGDTLDKAKHHIEMEMTLKREVEMARVRELVAKGRENLDKYLEENGYMDILKEKDTLTDDKIVELIGASFEAKKIALLAEINNKLGKRQVSEKATDADIQKTAKEVVQETKEERARLAQVVLFNNVITSYLTLKKKDGSGKTEDVGRNVNAWKKEEKALTASKVDPTLFENLKASNDGVSGLGKDNQIAGFEILDEILGKEKKE